MKLAPLTVAISAIVGLMKAQLVPLICAASCAAMNGQAPCDSKSVPGPLPSDAEQLMLAPLFVRAVRITLLALTEAVAFGSLAALIAAASAMAMSPEPSVESWTCEYVLDPMVMVWL